MKFAPPAAPIETKLGKGLERLANGIVDAANQEDVDLPTKLAALRVVGAFWAAKNKIQPTDPEGSAFDKYGKSLALESPRGDGDASYGSDGSESELSFDQRVIRNKNTPRATSPTSGLDPADFGLNFDEPDDSKASLLQFPRGGTGP